MIIDCIGCLHGKTPALAGGDLLIVTGDLTARDKPAQYEAFAAWLRAQDYKHKIVIGGNHDTLLCHRHSFADWCGGTYLCNSMAVVEGLKVWGTPHSLWFRGINPHCHAFTGSEYVLGKVYAKIPDDIDILVSHTPMYSIHDANREGDLCGSTSLYHAVLRIKPKLFVCSHIHEQGGQQILLKHQGTNTKCVNCSHLDENYDGTRPAMRVELNISQGISK